MGEEEHDQNWRDTRYWIQECDSVLKEKIDFIKSLYEKYAGSRPNEKKGFQVI
jgi:hypothetical protein